MAQAKPSAAQETPTPDIPELKDFTVCEDKQVSSNKVEKKVKVNGKEVPQTITTTTTKETLATPDKTQRKIKTTVETVTETKLPDGVTEVAKNVQVSVADVGNNSVDEHLAGFKTVGEPKEETTSKTEDTTVDGVKIKRKTTVTTTIQNYANDNNTKKRTKTTTKTVTEDTKPDGSVSTKTAMKVALTGEDLVEQPS